MHPYKWIWKYIRKYLHLMIAGLIFTLVASALGLVSPYMQGRIVDEVFEQGVITRLRPLLLIIIIVTFIKTLFHYAFKQAFERVSQGALVNLRQDIYDRVQKQTFTFFDENRVGDIMSRMTGDLDAIRHFFAFVVYNLFENIVTFIAAMFLIFTISLELFLLILVLTPIIAYVAYRQSVEIKPAFWRVREQFSVLNTVCQENISGNRVVKAFAKEDYEIEKFTEQNQEFWQANVDAARIWLLYLPILEFCAGALFFVLLLAGGCLVILDKLPLWKLVTVNGYLWAVYNPLRNLGWMLNDTQRFVASLDKVYAMMREKILIKPPENAVKPDNIKGRVEFKDVSFGYGRCPTKNLVLKNISFTVLPGQTIGIVGATASGKTTLVNLIGRFYDVTSGAVLVDNIDVREYDLISLRRFITAANQDVFLFSDTIAGNIAYGASDTSDTRITKCAVTASADDFIKAAPGGYETIVGERGVGLSGGQKQRLSLARALAPDPSIIILDDTTSSVDTETEDSIQRALRENCRSKTVFIIAHRLSSVMKADMIYVIENGGIAERGTHKELLQTKGYYHNLFINQYGGYVNG